jgi:hypothetical protein
MPNNTKLVRSAHKDKHAGEEWNQDSVPVGMLNGTLIPKRTAIGKAADLFVFFVNGTTRVVGLIVSKIRRKGTAQERVIITAFEEKDAGYWDQQAAQFEEDAKK